VFVHQSSQASASHLISGVLRGLRQRRPVLLNVYTPCPVEHGLPDDWAQHSARLALESRAFPYLTYDPDAGASFAECLSLEGNPAPESAWPSYTLKYLDEADQEQSLELPLTIADWAATEARFKQHFSELAADVDPDRLLPFHEYCSASTEQRADRVPYISVLGSARRLRRLRVSEEMVRLAEERQSFWSMLRQLAGLEVARPVRDSVSAELEAEFTRRAAQLRSEYEARLKQLEQSYPLRMARRLAEGLLRTSGGAAAVQELLASLPAAAAPGNGTSSAVPEAQAPQAPPNPPAAVPVAAAPAAATPAAAPSSAPAAVEEPLAIEAYIDSVRCTTCNECTNLNGRMFAYNAEKQAYVKDAAAGTFQQLVLAAERCPVSIIHPGTPRNPNEKDLAKWLKRSERFQ